MIVIIVIRNNNVVVAVAVASFFFWWGGHLLIRRFYLYEVVIYNISITLALYSLVVFYLASEPYLAPFHPLLKFVMVKSIIFVTWWQGLVLNLLAKVSDFSKSRS